jgi:hypothetical protein
LLASLLVATVGIRPALLLAFIPGLLAAAAITIAAREARATVTSTLGRRALSLNSGSRDGQFSSAVDSVPGGTAPASEGVGSRMTLATALFPDSEHEGPEHTPD